MMCARPAVVSPAGGNSEVVVDSETGFVARGVSAEELRRALERGIAAFDQWERIGHHARTRAQELWSDDPGQSMLQVLEETLQTARKS